MEDYLAARKVAVGKQMRTYMDSYFKFDPEYSALDDAGRDMFVARYNVKDGGRIEYQTGGISSANTLAENIARNRAAQAAFQQSIAPAQERVRQRMRGVPEQRTMQAQEPGTMQTLENFGNKLKRSFPVAETLMNVAAPAINLGRGILGLQDPIGTPSMGDRMKELEATKGPTGSIGYEDYGLPVATPGGRFTGGLPELALSNPVDFALAGSVGRYGFSPEGRTDLKYDFTPDQDTGSTGNAILDFVNEGGVKAKVSDLLTPSTAEAAETTPTPDAGTNLLPGFSRFIANDALQPPGSYNYIDNKGNIYTEKEYADLKNQRPTMADVAGPSTMLSATGSPDSEFEDVMRKITGDSEGYAAYAGIIPGFKARKRSDGRFEYKALDGQIYGPDTYEDIAAGKYPNIYDPRANVAGGGMPMGIMRSNKAGVMERDYRDKGGFVPVGIKEKADDVPAMLSKNEFVMTANAVRGAGNGSIEKGAQRMYDTMKRLEKRVR